MTRVFAPLTPAARVRLWVWLLGVVGFVSLFAYEFTARIT